MRILFALLVCVVPLMSFGQGLKLTPITTNRTMNAPVSGGVYVWNATAGQWSNVVVTATATNAIANAHGLGTNTSFYGATTNNGTLRQVSSALFLGSIIGTNGNIELLNDGFNMTVGVSGGVSAVEHHASLHLRAGFTIDDSGARAIVQNTATLEVQHGSSLQVGTSTAIGIDPSFIRIGTNDYLLLDGSVDPPTSGAGRLHFDTDVWAASRGALQFHDGTENTMLIGVLKSDTPSNGQVPTWNTGGTIDWKTPAGSGDVTKVGTPVNNQIGVWTGDGTLEGTTALTMDGEVVQLTHASNPGFKVIRSTIATNTYLADAMDVTGSSYSFSIASGAAVFLMDQAKLYVPSNLVVRGFIHSASGLIPSNAVPKFNTGTNMVASGLNIDNATNVSGAQTMHVVGGLSAGSLQSSNAIGPASLLRLYETNGTFSHTIQGATQMSRSSSNIVGVFETASASVLVLNTRQQQWLDETNRMAANTTLVITNSVPGDECSVTLLGAVAGGTDYTCTLVVNTGQLIINQDGTNNAVALSMSIPVPAGSGVEINTRTKFALGTNWVGVLTSKHLH